MLQMDYAVKRIILPHGSYCQINSTVLQKKLYYTQNYSYVDRTSMNRFNRNGHVFFVTDWYDMIFINWNKLVLTNWTGIK